MGTVWRERWRSGGRRVSTLDASFHSAQAAATPAATDPSAAVPSAAATAGPTTWKAITGEREREEKKKLYNILMSFHPFLLRIITIIIVWFRCCSLLSAVTFKETVTKKNLVQLVYYFILLYCRHFVASSCYVYSIFVSFLLRGRNFWNRRRRWRKKRDWNANGTRKSDCSLSRIKRNGNRALLRHPKSSRNFRWVE